MNISCPQCSSVYRVDPARVPHGGIVARCRECGAALKVEPGETPPGETRAATLAPETEAGASAAAADAPASAAAQAEAAPAPETTVAEAEAPPAPPAAPPAGGAPAAAKPAFGPQDPETRAKRLARALVSDIVVYNRDKWKESRTAGTLRSEFRDEILKSWEEYVEQVGEDMAKKSPYFRDALNAILAEGNRVF